LLADGYMVASLPVDSSRRALARKLGVVIALLPLITSLSAPTALAAISCSGPCTGGPGRALVRQDAFVLLLLTPASLSLANVTSHERSR